MLRCGAPPAVDDPGVARSLIVGVRPSAKDRTAPFWRTRRAMVVESGLVWLWAHDPSVAVARSACRPHRAIPRRDQPWGRSSTRPRMRLPTFCWAVAGGLLVTAAAAVLCGIDIAVVGSLLVGAAALVIVAAFSAR